MDVTVEVDCDASNGVGSVVGVLRLGLGLRLGFFSEEREDGAGDDVDGNDETVPSFMLLLCVYRCVLICDAGDECRCWRVLTGRRWGVRERCRPIAICWYVGGPEGRVAKLSA